RPNPFTPTRMVTQISSVLRPPASGGQRLRLASLATADLRACWQTLLAAPPAPGRRPAALSSSPIQQRYRLLLRLAGPPPGSPGASTEDLPIGSEIPFELAPWRNPPLPRSGRNPAAALARSAAPRTYHQPRSAYRSALG